MSEKITFEVDDKGNARVVTDNNSVAQCSMPSSKSSKLAQNGKPWENIGMTRISYHFMTKWWLYLIGGVLLYLAIWSGKNFLDYKFQEAVTNAARENKVVNQQQVVAPVENDSTKMHLEGASSWSDFLEKADKDADASGNLWKSFFELYPELTKADVQKWAAAEKVLGKNYSSVVKSGTTVTNTMNNGDGSYSTPTYKLNKDITVLVDDNGRPMLKKDCSNTIRVIVIKEEIIDEVVTEKTQTIIEKIPIIKRIVIRKEDETPKSCVVNEEDQHAPWNPSTQPVQENIVQPRPEWVEENERAEEALEIQEQQFSEVPGGLEKTDYGTPGDGNGSNDEGVEWFTPEAVTITPSGVVWTAPEPTTVPVNTPMTGVTDTAGSMPVIPN